MSRTALVVEDDVAIRQLLVAVLANEHCEVVEAVDGASALAAARASQPDVILLDIGLPDMDGLAVLQALKGDADLRSIPVIMVTAWAEPHAVRQAMDGGAADFVSKPFSVSHLLGRVDATLQDVAAAASLSAAATDPGTDLPVREHLDVILQRQAAASERTGRSYAVVLVAVDGHADVGETLRAVASRFRPHLNVSDALVRYDQETLALVLPGADAEAAATRVGELRKALASSAITIRVGIAASDGVASTLGQAEDALRRA